MAELIWTEPALDDLNEIAEFIARDKELAAARLVQRVFQHVEQLIAHPERGGRIPEFRKSRYRQILSRHAGCSTASMAGGFSFSM